MFFSYVSEMDFCFLLLLAEIAWIVFVDYLEIIMTSAGGNALQVTRVM